MAWTSAGPSCDLCGKEKDRNVYVIAANSVVVPCGMEDTPMHTVTQQKDKKNVVKLPPFNPAKVKRGHRPHRGGAGTHDDRRLKRLRSRGDQRRVAIGET